MTLTVIRACSVGLLLIAGAGCFEQSPADGSLKCAPAPARACPGGYYCADDNTCWRLGRAPDLSAIPDGSTGDGSSGDGFAGDAAVVVDGATPDLQCVNLQCQQNACDGGSTTVSGTVFTPSGKLPLPGVVVYVPNTTPAAMPNGISSGSCPACYASVTGSPITLTTTDVNGNFRLGQVPAGDDVPLVIQVGRWRRQVTIPHVAACAETAVDPALTHLPRNRTEGDIPQMAITTSGADEPECLLRVAGIDDSEFVRPGDPGGRIHLYNGTVTGGAAVVPDGGVDAGATDTVLFNDGPRWGNYDLVILACDGNFNNKSGPELMNFANYADSGGRVFVAHWGLSWLQQTEYVPVATFHPGGASSGTLLTSVDTNSDGGARLAAWLDAHLDGGQPYPQQLWRNDFPAVSSSAQRLLFGTAPTPVPSPTVQQFSFETPVGAGQQCGHILFSDFHPYAPFGASRFPAECANGAVTPGGELELIYMLFNQPTCVP